MPDTQVTVNQRELYHTHDEQCKIDPQLYLCRALPTHENARAKIPNIGHYEN